MKVFLDTNIFLDYLQHRAQYRAVKLILDYVEDGVIKAVISVGGIYTLAYLVRMELKRHQVYRPEQTMRLRAILNNIISLVSVSGLSHKRTVRAINDLAFDDIEDSFQHQCAVENKCDIIITINSKHFNCTDIKVMTPQEFIEYINPTKLL